MALLIKSWALVFGVVVSASVTCCLMESQCTDGCVDVAVPSVVICALPFNCAFWYCSQHCYNILQCFNSDWYVSVDGS